MKRNSVWKMVNRCIVCGTALKFVRSSIPGAKEDEGSRYCEHNHKRFSVYGEYDGNGRWTLTYQLPR